jgi:hypothetical protein
LTGTSTCTSRTLFRNLCRNLVRPIVIIRRQYKSRSRQREQISSLRDSASSESLSGPSSTTWVWLCREPHDHEQVPLVPHSNSLTLSKESLMNLAASTSRFHHSTRTVTTHNTSPVKRTQRLQNHYLHSLGPFKPVACPVILLRLDQYGKSNMMTTVPLQNNTIPVIDNLRERGETLDFHSTSATHTHRISTAPSYRRVAEALNCSNKARSQFLQGIASRRSDANIPKDNVWIH